MKETADKGRYIFHTINHKFVEMDNFFWIYKAVFQPFYKVWI